MGVLLYGILMNRNTGHHVLSAGFGSRAKILWAFLAGSGGSTRRAPSSAGNGSMKAFNIFLGALGHEKSYS